MSPLNNGLAQLDQLEKMYNRLLEQTGHLLQAAAKGNTTSASAHAMRLQQDLPIATTHFHEALDHLEGQLMVAKAVLQRDYVLSRDRQNVQTNGAKSEGVDAQTRHQVKDIDMHDQTDLSSPPEKPNVATKPVPTASESKPPVTNPSSAAHTDSKVDASTLKIDTSASHTQSPNNDQNDPATAGGSAFDFDSLFNDSATAGSSSASPSKNNTTNNATPAASGENTDGQQNQQPDFSFGNFNDQNPDTNDVEKGEEDVSSLLPGLESYANAAGDEGQDVSMVDSNDGGKDQKGGNEQQQGGDGNQNQQQQQQRDTTFDDIMDFGDFDMGSLGAGDGSGGFDDTRFDDSFFNLE